MAQNNISTNYNISTDTTLKGAVALNVGTDILGQLAILFDYIKEETSSSEAMITDNWVESNYTLQDHIAIKPRVYRLRGCVGEVVNRPSSKYADYAYMQLKKALLEQQILSYAKNAVTELGNYTIPFAPVMSWATQLAQKGVGYFQKTQSRFKQSFPMEATVDAEFAGRRQAYVYAALRYALENRVEVTLDGLQFDDTERLKFKKGVQYQRRYFLQSVTARQGENAFISDIEVTVKEFRIAVTKFTTPKETQVSPKAVQATAEKDNGLAKGVKVETPSFVDNTLGKAQTISSTPKETPSHFIKTTALKIIEEAKIRVRNWQ